MKTIAMDLTIPSRSASVSMIVILLLAFSFRGNAAESKPQAQVDATKVGPRAVEPLTEQMVTRDYRNAWTNLARAIESSSLDPIQGPFTGDAKRVLTDTIASQQKSGLRQRFVDQTHKVEAVFYAPEGDVIELRDSAEYQHQVLDGGKLIQNERIAIHYVVLMTPSADGWVVRYLQAVPQF